MTKSERRVGAVFIGILFSCMAVLAANVFAFAKVSALDYNDIAAEPSYEVEVSQGMSYIPPLQLDGEWMYAASVFGYDDTEYASPLAENVTEFLFDKVGKYRIRYTVQEIAGDRSKILDSVVDVVDTTAPTIELTDIYDKQTTVGSAVKICDALVTDNSGDGALQCSVAVFLNEKDVTDSVQDGTITPGESGTLKIVYTSADAAGNAGRQEVLITVAESTSGGETQDGGCGGTIGISVMSIAAVITVAAAALMGRKKSNG